MNFDTLVVQTQIAHRLVVGFYQRLIPNIKRVAAELEFTFWEWDPDFTERPCKKNKDPADHWAWDMVPMLASKYSYCRTNGTTTEVGDALLNMYISFDSHFSNSEWEELGLTEDEEPDVTQIPMGDAVVHIYLSRCNKRSDTPLMPLWNESNDMEDEENNPGRWQTISPHFNAVFLKKSLADFIARPEETIAQLRALLDEPASQE